jgi:hypothetical protein
MVIAHLVFGPHDGECLILPMDHTHPWARIVIPRFGQIQAQWFYLRAGRLDEADWSYLFDDSYGGITA